MYKPTVRTKENIKTIMIVVLFLLAILLSSFLWGPGTLSNLKSSIDDMFDGDEETYTPEILQVLRPEQIIVSFDAGLYTTAPFGDKDLWADCAQQIKAFSDSGNVSVEEVSAQHLQNMKDDRSLQMEFSYSIPFRDFCECYNITWNTAYDQVSSLSCIEYFSASPDCLFLYDRDSERYYQLMADGAYTEFEAIIDGMESSGYVPYYSAGSYFGVENQAVIPLSMPTTLTEVEVGSENLSSTDAQTQRVAETFFGESFDFVRRITESRGSVIFMYGYSEKVLTIKPEGVLEYREEIPADNVDQSYAEALNTVLQFVSAHGGWPANLQPYLMEVEPIEQNRTKGYHFAFGMGLAGSPTYYGAGFAPIEAEVFNGKVTYYSRSIAVPTEEGLAAIEGAASWEAFPAVNMIAQNYAYLGEILEEAGVLNFHEEITPEEVFDQVASLIDGIQPGYFLDEGTTELVPAWCLSMGEVKAWFSLYDAFPLGYQL